MDKIFDAHGIVISPESCNKLEHYIDLLISWNKKVNLTAITEPGQIIIKHFLDSLMLMKYEQLKGKTLIDIGTGAGLPGLVLKIAENDLDVVLLDSLAKRITFLNKVISEFELKNVRTYHARAEDSAHDLVLRENFDIATSRAVARLNILCEYALPYVKTGGIFAAYKGPEYAEELKEAELAIETMGAKLDKVYEFKLEKDSPRSLIFIRKLSQTSAHYPRKPHIIARKPIIR